jgi:hypothetical protein
VANKTYSSFSTNLAKPQRARAREETWNDFPAVQVADGYAIAERTGQQKLDIERKINPENNVQMS